jgi:hypothetical protein
MAQMRIAGVKRYRVCLSIGGVTFVHATHFEKEGHWTRFYRDGTMIAEFATASVLRLEEVRRLSDPPSTQGGRRRH